jgi:uncharacterized protein (DUF362 family)
MYRVFLERLGDNYEPVIRAGLESIGKLDLIRRTDRIFIKPNLTYPSFRKGVMTNPAAVEALIRVLSDYSQHIVVGESDSGGYNPFSMHQVFRETGVYDIANRYGVRLVNLTDEPSRPITVPRLGHSFSVPLPVVILDETDHFFTMPVPKIHMNTRVSMSIKNQWGIIQSPAQRLKLHPYFIPTIHAINRALPPAVSVIDGRYGLTRSGPMRGDVVDLNWLLVADNLFAADYLCCHLMGIAPQSVPHIRTIARHEGIRSLDQFALRSDWRTFIRAEFYLERAWTDYPGLLAFKSRALAYIAYESWAANALHKALYLFREPFY